MLRYIVEQTIKGAGDALDEQSIRQAIFGGNGPAANPIVRVEAHRLRSKLAEYYLTEGRHDPVEISLLHRRYSAVFHDRGISRQPQYSETGARSLLVHRFENLERSPRATLFVAGFMTELLHTLTQLRDLRVIAGNSWNAGRFKEALVRSELDAVLEGTIRFHGKCVRLSAQLTGADGTVLWSEIFERSSKDPSLQQYIACSVSEGVRAALCLGRKPGTSAGGTDSKAHLLYLKGCYQCDLQRPGVLHKSVRCFEQAVELAPQYALPHVGLARAYALLAAYGERRMADVSPLIRLAATRALELDPGVAEGHVWLATAGAVADCDLIPAASGFQTALEMDPGDLAARTLYVCCCLLPWGRFEEAVAHMRLTVEMGPLVPMTQNVLAWALHFAGDSGSALGQLHQAADLNPALFVTQWSLGLVHEALCDQDAAISAFLEARAMCGAAPFVMGSLGHAYGVFGMEDKARDVAAQLIQIAGRRYVPALDIALVYAGAGETGPALDFLEKAAEERCAWMPLLGIDGRWRKLHREPRFQALLDRLRLSLVR